MVNSMGSYWRTIGAARRGPARQVRGGERARRAGGGVRTRLPLRPSVKVWTIAACLAVASPVAAQWTAGARAGVVSADFASTASQRSERISAFAGGAFFTYHMIGELSFQAELLYVQKGGRLAVDEGGTAPMVRVDLDYIEVPVMLRIDIEPIPREVTLYAYAGPVAGLNTSCEVTDSGATRHGCDNGGFSLGVRTFDWSMMGGGGLGFRVGGITAFMDGRLEVGLATIDDAAVDWRRTNRALLVTAGISIPLGNASR
ncbi:MAG: porin family protein [Gemmatimonadota bacterium]